MQKWLTLTLCLQGTHSPWFSPIEALKLAAGDLFLTQQPPGKAKPGHKTPGLVGHQAGGVTRKSCTGCVLTEGRSLVTRMGRGGFLEEEGMDRERGETIRGGD